MNKHLTRERLLVLERLDPLAGGLRNSLALVPRAGCGRHRPLVRPRLFGAFGAINPLAAGLRAWRHGWRAIL